MNSTPLRKDSEQNSLRALRQRIGANLRRLRKARRLNQRQLGQWVGIDSNFVSDVECGRRNLTLASLETLAKGLNCCESELLLTVTAAESPPSNPPEGSPSTGTAAPNGMHGSKDRQRTRRPRRRQGPNRKARRTLRRRIGLNVRQLRKAREMTQQQLARRIADPYSKSLISATESGHRNLTLASLHALAAALHCDEAVLLLPHPAEDR